MDKKVTGIIKGINGNMINVEFDGRIIQNEVGYVIKGKENLKSEVIKIKGNVAFMQVFESTKGLKVGDKVDFNQEMLSVELGPGILGQIYDGLQNPLPALAEKYGFFLPRGVNLDAIDFDKKWEFTPIAKKGDVVYKGSFLGKVPEGIYDHKIMVPFDLNDEYTVESIQEKGKYKVSDIIAVLKDSDNNKIDIIIQGVFNNEPICRNR